MKKATLKEVLNLIPAVIMAAYIVVLIVRATLEQFQILNF